MKLKDTFTAGVLAAQLKAKWLNAVAWCLNTIHGGTHVDVTMPANPGEGSGITVGLDMDGLCADLRNRGFYTKTSTDDDSEESGTGGTPGNLASFDAQGNLADSGQPKPGDNCAFVQGVINSFTKGNLVKAGDGDLIEDTGVKAEDVIGVTEPDTTSEITSGANTQASRAPLTSNWGATFGNAGGDGVVVYLACRAVDDGANGSIYFRPFTISSDGRIYSIGNESANMFTCITT
ncbi:MAG: hypothetical protein ACI4Q3_00620 [Kiritimatiellia bacterium]